MNVPYPHAPSRKDTEWQFARFLDILKRLHINIPFTKALEQMSTYARFMKASSKTSCFFFFFRCSCSLREPMRSSMVISSKFLDSTIAHTTFSKSSVNEQRIFFGTLASVRVSSLRLTLLAIICIQVMKLDTSYESFILMASNSPHRVLKTH